MEVSGVVVAAARYSLGVATSEELVETADETLAHGTYTLALGELAGTTNPVMADVGPLFERSLQELGVAHFSKEDAVWVLLRHYIGRIAQGMALPRVEFRRVLQGVYYPAELYQKSAKHVGDSHGLDQMIGCFYGYDDLEACPTEISFAGKYGDDAVLALDDEFVRQAKSWLEKYPASPTSAAETCSPHDH
jgi:hypothetical protein